jgi:hypothetical protein
MAAAEPAPAGNESVSGEGVSDDAIAKAATSAWLTAFFASPAGHRANAQAGYTVAAAVAAAVVAAGALASVDDAPFWIQIPAVVSLALWLYAAWKFMRAVAMQPSLAGIVHQGSERTLAHEAIERTWRERGVIAQRSKTAQKTAAVAGVATFITVVLVVARGTSAETDATLLLTKAGAVHMKALCGTTPGTIDARVDPAALSDDVIALRDVSCGGDKRTLRLRKADIAVASTD